MQPTNGCTAPALIDRYEADLDGLAGDSFVSVMIGANDANQQRLGNGGSVAAFTADYATLLNWLLGHFERARIVVILESKTGATPGGAFDTLEEEYNAGATIAASSAGVTVVDAYAVMANCPGGIGNCLSADGIHPNDAGYALIAAAVERGFSSGGGRSP